jgi:hypothetical protein
MTATKTTTITVPCAVMEYAIKHYCADTLDMYDFRRSRGKVFSWNGKTWTCTGSVQNGSGLIQVTIREVVTKDRYTGPGNIRPVNTWRNYGPDYYLGGEFQSGKQIWVMTDNEACLEPDGASPEQTKQLSLFQ